MLEIIEKSDHLLIKLKVSPGASKNMISGIWGDALKISITAPPERGKANKEIIRFLANKLQLKKTSIAIVHGQSSSQKTIAIYNCSQKKLHQILGAYCENH